MTLSQIKLHQWWEDFFLFLPICHVFKVSVKTMWKICSHLPKIVGYTGSCIFICQSNVFRAALVESTINYRNACSCSILARPTRPSRICGRRWTPLLSKSNSIQHSKIFAPHQQWEGSEVFNLKKGVGQAEALCDGDVEEWHHCQTKRILSFSVLLPKPGSLSSLWEDRFLKILRPLKLSLWKSLPFTWRTG